MGLNEIMANPIGNKRTDMFVNVYLAYSLDKLIFRSRVEPSFK